MVMLPSWSMMIGVPSFHPGQLSSTQIRVAHSQMSYPPERIPDRLMYDLDDILVFGENVAELLACRTVTHCAVDVF